MNQLVSVIMPAFNASRFLDQAIKSVLGQTYKNIELVICDDCSTDGVTQNMIKEAAKKDKRIVFLENEENSGPFKTLQRCYLETRGEFIFRVDSDDVISETAIEKLLAYIEGNNLDAAFSNVIHINGEGDVIMKGIYNYFEDPTVLHKRNDYRKLLGMRYMGGILAKRSYLNKIDYSFFEGKELYYFESFFFDDSKIGFLPDAVYYYRIFGQNNSSIAKTVKNNKNDDNYFDVIPDFQNRISDKTIRSYAEMLYLRARYPIAIFRSLNNGKKYSLKLEMKRLKRATNYRPWKMMMAIPFFSKRNRIMGYCILLHGDWLARLIAKRKLIKATK